MLCENKNCRFLVFLSAEMSNFYLLKGALLKILEGTQSWRYGAP